MFFLGMKNIFKRKMGGVTQGMKSGCTGTVLYSSVLRRMGMCLIYDRGEQQHRAFPSKPH
jgi:hypothetical protein